jgi:hypothetical protein
MRSDNNLTRARAAYHLGKLGSVRSIPFLLEELEKPPGRASFDSAIRSADPEAIRKAAEQPVAHLWAAAYALGDIGRPAVPELIRALKQGDERVQYFAIRALAGAGTDAQEAVPSLLEQLLPAGAGSRTAQVWGFVLALASGAIALCVQANFYPTIAVLAGLGAFAVVFAVNSAVHSYLILAYTDSDKVALNVGFYYMANAIGRLLGTLLSGIMYLVGGLPGCLWGSTALVLAAAALTLRLPTKAVREVDLASVAGASE